MVLSKKITYGELRSLRRNEDILATKISSNHVNKVATMLRLLEGAYSKRFSPQKCGRGCCISNGNFQKNSLLGSDFVDYYLDPPTFPSYELAAISTDTSSLPWWRSGLESSSVRSMEETAGRLRPQGLRGHRDHYLVSEQGTR